MVKSLLLGTAAGVVAVAGAQAADLPVKAKPVQYVKICSLYGAGFYYIPGTDMCLKIGGWTRVYDAYGVNGNATNGALATGYNDTRSSQQVGPRVRGYITADARNQTEYGTVRSYIAVGYSSGLTQSGVGSGNQTAPGTTTALTSYDNGLAGFNANRAFIQFAGFTFGLTPSFYDLYSQAATSYWGGMVNPASDTSDPGWFIYGAYTAQFGNGFSATLAAEQPRTTAVLNGGTISAATGLATANNFTFPSSNLGIQPSSSAEGGQWPDIVANLRVDQAWGSAQIMGAVHNANATYYTSSDTSGHPSDAVGWAVGAGVKINFPSIGPGDYLQAQVNYTEGARKYVDFSYNNMYSMFNGGGYGIGIGSDGVYATGTSIELTTAWGVNAAYEHWWNKHWQTSVYGAYTSTSYDSNANAYMCAAEQGSGAFTGLVAGGVLTSACDNNFQVWTVGTRTNFNLDANTYIGVDVVYEQLNTALSGATALYGNGAEAAGPRTVGDQSAWMAQFRVHRNFYP